ncbi:MAG: ribbon-helix-helix domain-containing protein [Neomegalonema sp.]|nr:ribbon-helix-helix domain-containing protein [Neomegalonema sp.]
MCRYAPARKHSVTLHGHRTSITLEPPFWEALQRLADREALSLNALVTQIDEERAAQDASVPLSSALRIRLLAAARKGEL